MTRIPVASLAVASLILMSLAGCAAPAAPAEPGEVAGASGEALLGLPYLEAEAKARDADAEHERLLWTESGLDEELGGTAKADEAFAAMQRWADDRRMASEGVTFEPASLTDGGAAVAGLGGGWFGLFMTDAVGLSALVDGTSNGQTGSKTTGTDGFTSTSTATETTLKLESSSTYTADGMTFTTRGTHEFDPCPDENGVVEVTSRQDIEGGSGASTVYLSVVVTTQLTANDDAGLASTAYDYDGATGYDGPGGSTGVRMGWGTKGGLSTWAVEGGMDDARAGSASVAVGLAAGLVVFNLEQSVPRGWQQPGRCVDLQVSASDGPTGLDPSAKVTLQANPRAKRDGAKAGGTVTAKLSGPESLDPNGTKVKADATFQYIAPDKKGSGNVTFTSRSKRGVGAASMTLSVGGRAYTISGGQNDFQGSGVACDLTAPFTITSGIGITQTFTPTSETGGNWTQSGNAAGVAWSGGGTYVIALADDGASGTLTGSGTSTIATPLGPFSDAANIVFSMTPTTC